jgi:threonine/homoserine/homoserine lactone efflux protein
MKILLRIVAVLFVAIGVFLIAAVINAISSENGARPGVAVAYVAGAIVLGFLAVWMWRRTATSADAPPPPAP